MKISEKYARINLACNYDLSGRFFLLLLEKYECAENILKDIPKISNAGIIKEKESKNDIKKINLDDVVVYGEIGYPNYLTQIPDPPIALFTKGNFHGINFEKAIAVVGTRKMSTYGIEVTSKLINFLVTKGFIIVSGLAYGIDALAHELTLTYGGQTIAVLGTSINEPYPQSNRGLYKRIIENHGLIISEDYFKQEYVKWMFPKRNRIIAGLCKKTIVIEAPKKSGALITANYAFDFNREVFAVPGPINSINCIGTHELIKNNKAQILTGFDDILDQEQLFFGNGLNNTFNSSINALSEDKKIIFDLIYNGANSFELLVQKPRNIEGGSHPSLSQRFKLREARIFGIYRLR